MGDASEIWIALAWQWHLLVADVIGATAIILGYKLFSQIPIKITNEGTIKIPTFGEAKLKVAPGIFFALLGTAMIYASVNRSLHLERTVRPDDVAAQTVSPNATKMQPHFTYDCRPGRALADNTTSRRDPN